MKRKLLLLAAFVAGALGMRAQIDVTDKYLQNADFSDGPVVTADYLYGYGRDIKSTNGVYGFQTVTGWTSHVTAGDNGDAFSNSAMGAGVLAYGSSTKLQGAGVTVPSSGPDGSTGNCFAFFGVWGCGGYFYQEVELVPGEYTINLPIYVVSKGLDTYIPTSYIGFLPENGINQTVAVPLTASTAWTTISISFTLDKKTKGKIAIGYQSKDSGSGNNPHIAIDKVQIMCTEFDIADDDDYTAFNSAIQNAKAKKLGFEEGEYAPYNNVEGLIALQQAETINTETTNSKSFIQELTKKLNEGWISNEKEVNAIWDASFEYEYSTTGYVQPIAWTGVGRAGSSHNNATDVRWMWDNTTNKGLNATSSKHALFTKFGATYGEQVGYTLPLKKETYYTLKFIYGGWGDCQGDGYVTMQDPDAASLSLDPSERLPLDNKTEANSKEDAWKNYRAFFKTNAEGNYVLGLRKDREASDQQSQYVYGDFAFFKTTVEEATEYYNGILEEVKKAYDEDAYDGSEKAAFKAAIDASMDGKSVSEIFDAAAELIALKDAFVAANEQYAAFNNLVAAAKEYDQTLPYASEEKLNAFQAALDAKPTNATDAKTMTNAITVAYRGYVESNSLAEGVEGSEVIDNLIVNPNFTEGTEGWNEIGAGGEAKVRGTNEEPLTDAEGNTYAYYDANNNDNNTRGISQTIILPRGKYLFAVASRGGTNIKQFKLEVGDQKVEMARHGNSGQVFGRGWNDYTLEYTQYIDGEVTVKVASYDNGGGDANKSPGWWSATRFRLVKIGDAATDVTVTEAGYATYVTPTAIEFGDDVEAFVVRSADGEKAQMEAITTAPAHTPVIIKATAETYTLTPIETAEEVGDNWLKISDGTVTRATGIYVLANIDDVVGFYALKEDVTLPEGKVYLEVPGTDDVKFIGFDFGETTGINAVEHINTENAVIYNLAGQRVQAPTRGIYIMNGKKVLVK